MGMAHTKAITAVIVCRGFNSADEKGTERKYSVPLSIYSVPGGLRQDRGHGAKSLAEAETQ
jgi:hypothetical protein